MSDDRHCHGELPAFQSEPGVVVEQWTPEDRCAFMTVNDWYYPVDDISVSASQSCIRLKVIADSVPEDAAAMRVAAKLDARKAGDYDGYKQQCAV